MDKGSLISGTVVYLNTYNSDTYFKVGVFALKKKMKLMLKCFQQVWKGSCSLFDFVEISGKTDIKLLL